jgi:hypothetical protein
VQGGRPSSEVSKHTMNTVVYWNKTVNMPKMKHALVVEQMSEALWYKGLETARHN